MNEIEEIRTRIHNIRGKQVMLDKDLAELYGVQTRDLNKAVKRNIERFPDDFMFQLTKEEMSNLMFQFGTSSWGGNGSERIQAGIRNLEVTICDFKLNRSWIMNKN